MVKRKEICQELINITPNEIEQLVRRVLGATRGELESHKISALGIAFTTLNIPSLSPLENSKRLLG